VRARQPFDLALVRFRVGACRPGTPPAGQRQHEPEEEQFGGDDRAAAVLTAIPILDMCVHISEWFHERGPLGRSDLQDRYVGLALRMAGALMD
jgi:Tetracyclin repressor-like, C-terminal domain